MSNLTYTVSYETYGTHVVIYSVQYIPEFALYEVQNTHHYFWSMWS